MLNNNGNTVLDPAEDIRRMLADLFTFFVNFFAAVRDVFGKAGE